MDPQQQGALHDELSTARWLYALLQRREEVFGLQSVLTDPSWCILLDLFIARAEGHAIPITSACAAALAPPTTALRHLSLLEKRGFVERTPDQIDRRRMFVSMTEEAATTMSNFLKGLRSLRRGVEG